MQHPRDVFRARWRARTAPALISVHRGLWSRHPENSPSGIRAAAEYGIVEIDVQMSKDGVPVVMHDPTLDRMTGDARRPGDLTRDEIRALTLREGGGGTDAGMTDERVPDLADAVAAMPEDGFFDFDVKYPDEVEAVAAWLSENGLSDRGSLKIDVGGAEELARLRALEERHGVMVMAKVMLPSTGPALIDDLVSAGVAAAEVYFDDLEAMTDACRRADGHMAMGTYTLDPVHCLWLNDARAREMPDEVWGLLVDIGVTVIMTDRAPQLGNYLARR